MAETRTRLDERTLGRIPVAQYFASSSTGNDSYAVTLDPIPTAYEVGREYEFKADVANVGSASLNVNGLGAKTIKKLGSLDLNDNDILAGQIVRCQYDGTYMQMISQVSGGIPVSQIYGSSATGNDTYAITLSPAPTAYEVGREYIFKADVANTGSASLNVNGLGAKTLVKDVSQTLVDGDIAAGAIIRAVFDGTNMQTIGGLSASNNIPKSIGSLMTYSGDFDTQMPVSISGDDTITHNQYTTTYQTDNFASSSVGSVNATNSPIANYTSTSDSIKFLSIGATGAVTGAANYPNVNVWNYTISTNTLTLSTYSAAFAGNTVSTPSCEACDILKLTSSQYVALYKKGSTHVQTIVPFTFNGTSITVGTAVELDPFPWSSFDQASMSQIDSTRILVSYMTASGTNARVVTISSNSATLGTAVTINSYSTSTITSLSRCATINSDKVLVTYHTAASSFSAVVLSISGTTVTINTPVSLSTRTSIVSPYIGYGVTDIAYGVGDNRLECFSISGTTITITSTTGVTLTGGSFFNVVGKYSIVLPYTSLLIKKLNTTTKQFHTYTDTSLTTPFRPYVSELGTIIGLGRTTGTSPDRDIYHYDLSYDYIPGIAEIVGSSTRVIYNGEFSLSSTHTTGQNMYASWGGELQTNTTYGHLVGVNKNGTTMIVKL